MKRTPLKRGGPLKRKTALKVRRDRPRREAAWRSRIYLQWLRTLPCVVCGGKSDDPHHIIGVGHHGGMGTKAGDDMAMPVCRRHHDEIHRNPELWPRQEHWVRETRAKARKDGWQLPGG